MLRTRERQIQAGATLLLLALVFVIGHAATQGSRGEDAAYRSGPKSIVGPGVSSQGLISPRKISNVIAGHSAGFAVSQPLYSIKPGPVAKKGEDEGPENPHLPVFTKPKPPVRDPVVQDWFSPLIMPAPIVTFEGTLNFSGVAPSDANGDIGPNHYVQMVNMYYQVFDRAGNVVAGPLPNNSIWSGLGGPCAAQNDGDPVVQYDQTVDRWLLSQFAHPGWTTGGRSGPFYECVAVSASPNPAGIFYLYAFTMTTSLFNDYPKIGVWPDGYYMSQQDFYTTTVGGNVQIRLNGDSAVALDRFDMLSGSPTARYQQVVITDTNASVMLPADLDGSALPPTAAPNYFLNLTGTNQLELWKFHVNWSDSASSYFTGPTTLTTANFTPNLCNNGLNCLPQPGTAVGLDAVSDRLMNRLAYRNMEANPYIGREVLLANHTVDVTGFRQAGIRWYEIWDPAHITPTIHQQGTYSPDSDDRWTGSIAMNIWGDVALGFSRMNGTSMYPSIHYTGRFVTDTLSTLPEGENSIVDGGASQTGANRWGDYSSMSVDPLDDCAFWYTNQYYKSPPYGAAYWQTRIGEFIMRPCSSGTDTPTPGATRTFTRTPTHTPTATATVTFFYEETRPPDTPTFTATYTDTTTATGTSTPSPTVTFFYEETRPPDTPTFTSTASATGTATASDTATPPPDCETIMGYVIASVSGVPIVPGATDTGNHCDNCTTAITLPFPFRLYGQNFSSANLSSNGTIQFGSNSAAPANVCLPTNTFNYAILPHWDDLTTACGGCGIFTSVSGSAPNRILNIEWRAFYVSSGPFANFEARLYEGASRFDFVYSQMAQFGASGTVGVQKGTGALSTQFECNTPNSLFPSLQLSFTQPCAAATATSTATATATATPATTLLVGHVTWQGPPSQPSSQQQQPITLTLKSGSQEVNYPSQNTDASGYFTVSVAGLPNGAYAWRAKGPKFLAASGNTNLAGAAMTNVEMGLMKAGDCDDNNVVNSLDFGILRNTFGLGNGQPSYDDRADFTADLVVNATDFNLLRGNFGQGGAPPVRISGP